MFPTLHLSTYMKRIFSCVLGGKQPITWTSPSLFELCDNTTERKRENEQGPMICLAAWPDLFLLLHKTLTAGRCLSHKFLKVLCTPHWICRRNEETQSLKPFSLSVYLIFSFKIYPDLLVIDWMIPLLTRGLWSSLLMLLGIKPKQWIHIPGGV